jgi:hypothetical protein
MKEMRSIVATNSLLFHGKEERADKRSVTPNPTCEMEGRGRRFSSVVDGLVTCRFTRDERRWIMIDASRAENDSSSRKKAAIERRENVRRS